MVYIIYSYPENNRVYKALIAAQYSGVEIEYPEFKFDVENKTEAFLKLNPYGKVPVMTTPDGPLFESNAIARYIAGLNGCTDLLGKSYFEQARVDQWTQCGSNQVGPANDIFVLTILGRIKFDYRAFNGAKEDILKSFGILDAHLKYNTFIVGNGVTLADITWFCYATIPLKMMLTKEARSKFPNVMRWFNTLYNTPQFRNVVGDIKFCVEPAQPPKAKNNKKNKGKKKQQQQKKKKQPQQQQQPKKKKPVNPLTLLPKSSMSLDAVKRDYSNFPYSEFSAKFFKEQLDREGWSIWIGAYNYNEDNQVFFMTCNLINGYIQRLESLRKWGFGAIVISGVDDQTAPFLIDNCFLVRGQDNPEELKGCPDSEYYTWRKANLDDAGDVAIVNAIWGGESYNGKPILKRSTLK